jgi:PAS domain S-box-containing protein
VLTRDGRTIWLWQNVNLLVEGDAVTGFHVIARDVTDRKLAEEALRERENTLRTITASAHDAIIMIDDHGVITFWNEAAEQIFGWSSPEALGRDLHLLLAPERYHEDHARAMEHFRSSGQGGSVGRTLELSAIRKDGSEVPIELSLSGVLIAGAWHGVGIMRDITDRKKAEAERMELDRRLQQAQKLESLAILAGGIAHDFNNLLMGVLGNLDLSLLDLAQGSRTRTLIEKAMASAHKAADLTRQMLAYSGKGRYVVGRVNVNDLIRQSEVLIRSAIPKSISLELALASRGIIEADADQVRQVVMNLVTNAHEAIGDAPGSITLRTGDMDCDAQCLGRSRIFEKPPGGRFVFVEVTDTGCGMDEETRQRLFDPFISTKFLGARPRHVTVLGIETPTASRSS